MSKQTNTARRHENRVAGAINGERTSAPYKNIQDTSNGKLKVECKARKKLPRWLWDAVEQAHSYIEGDEFVAVSFHEKGKWLKNDLIVLTMPDFIRLAREAGLIDGRVSVPGLPEQG